MVQYTLAQVIGIHNSYLEILKNVNQYKNLLKIAKIIQRVTASIKIIHRTIVHVKIVVLNYFVGHVLVLLKTLKLRLPLGRGVLYLSLF